MEANISRLSKNLQTEVPNQRPLRALIEIDGGELKVFPIANSDADEQLILDALRFVREDWRR